MNTMKFSKAIGFLTLSVFLFLSFGCAHNRKVDSLTKAQSESFYRMEIIDGIYLKGANFERLGSVEGVSCQWSLFSKHKANEEEALEVVKIRAAMAGGNAVTNVLCKKSIGADWWRNCAKSVICNGEAIRLQD